MAPALMEETKRHSKSSMNPHHALTLKLVFTLQLKWILHDQINQNLSLFCGYNNVRQQQDRRTELQQIGINQFIDADKSTF